MNKLLYISTGLPTKEVELLRKKQYDFSSNAILPLSTFHGNILSGLAENYDEIVALSGVPISHRNFKVLRYSGKTIQSGKIRYVIPGFFNLPGIKQLTTVIKFFPHILRWCKKNKNENCHIVIDGCFYTGLLPLWAASKFTSARIGAIIVDYYDFMDPGCTAFKQKLYYKMLSCIDRFVFVTDHLDKLVNKLQKPSMIMEGLVAPVPVPDVDPAVDNYCMYAGGLHEIYGVKNLVDAFHQTELPYSLHLYGNGDTVDYIQEVGRKDPRIVYKGIVSHDQLLEIERSAKLLINPRPVYGKLDTRFNFPSKLMEFMQSGRPVITTKLLGIPKEYENYMYFFESDTTQQIKADIERVLSQNESDLICFAHAAREYVNENKNSLAAGKRIFSLMNAHGGT